MYPRHEIQNPAYEPETRTQQNCKNVRKIGLILQNHFHILHYSSGHWAAASLKEDSSLGPEMTNQAAFPIYYKEFMRSCLNGTEIN